MVLVTAVLPVRLLGTYRHYIGHTTVYQLQSLFLMLSKVEQRTEPIAPLCLLCEFLSRSCPLTCYSFVFVNR